MRNAWVFHLLVIIAALMFCARPVYADGSAFAPPAGYKIYDPWHGVYVYGDTALAACEQLLPALFAINAAHSGHTAATVSQPGYGTKCYLYHTDDGWYSDMGEPVSTSYCPVNSTGTSSCLCDAGYEPNASLTACVPANNCAAPGEYAGTTVSYAGEGKSQLCAADLCLYTTTGVSITGGYALEPPNPSTLSTLYQATGESCTAVDGAGSGGCPAGQANLGFGCMTFAENQAIFDALANPVQFVDPCIAAGTCTPQTDPCIAAGTCTGTGLGVAGTAGSNGSTGAGSAGSRYIDPCIIAGTCTAAADPCIAAGTCTGTGTGAGGTAGAVNPCIATGTCAGSGAGTGSGNGSATEFTQHQILDQLKSNTLFSTLGNAPVDEKIQSEGIVVQFTPLELFNSPACPAPITYSLIGINREISYQPACDFLDHMRPLILAFATISVAVIYIRGFTPA
jgi:hypothetical protein